MTALETPAHASDPGHVLAVYGTLRPGGSNHGQVANLTGTWIEGTVRALLYPTGAGAATGYPGIVLDPHGDVVSVHLLVSTELTHHWARLDTFEGAGYRRVLAEVSTRIGPVTANIYELEPGSRPGGSLAR